MTQDMINAAFEFIGAWMTLRNVLQVRRDKGYAGIYLPAILFFSTWGIWNLYFYPLLGQWLSFIGASCLVAANLAWVMVMLHYGRKQ